MTAEVIFLHQQEETNIPKDVWECNCGCQLFYVNFEGWTCSNCSTYQIFKE
jgi:hypothetical protein